MSSWSAEQRARIGAAEELEVAGLRSDGSLGRPRIVWVVRLGDELYIRSVNGPDAAWYRGVQRQQRGRIWAAGVEAGVGFVADHADDDALDAGYRAKYGRYVGPTERITSETARSTTLRLVPLTDDSD